MSQNTRPSEPLVKEPSMRPIETEANENSYSVKPLSEQADEDLGPKRRKVETAMKRGFCVQLFRIDPELKDEDSRTWKPSVDKWVSNLPKNGKIRTPDFKGEKPIMMIIPIFVEDANHDPSQEE